MSGWRLECPLRLDFRPGSPLESAASRKTIVVALCGGADVA
jgi:hypothetical protein